MGPFLDIGKSPGIAEPTQLRFAYQNVRAHVLDISQKFQRHAVALGARTSRRRGPRPSYVRKC